MLLLTQPYSRVLSSKKVPLVAVYKYLIGKGLSPTPAMTKSDVCLAFKSLIEHQSGYSKQPVQPIQPIQPIQPMQMPFASILPAMPQNNNMMQCQPYQIQPVQQVCINSNKKMYKMITFF